MTYFISLQDPLNLEGNTSSHSQRRDFIGFRVVEEHDRFKTPHITSYDRIKDSTDKKTQSTTAKSTAEKLPLPKRKTDLVDGRLDGILVKTSGDIIDLDTNTDVRHGMEFHDLNLTEENLLPSGRAKIPPGSSRNNHTPTDILTQRPVENRAHSGAAKSSHKHGDVILGSDGRRYRLLKGPQGPVGPPGKRVSNTSASNDEKTLTLEQSW